MATALGKPTLGVTVHFVIDEEEARALDALSGYGDDAFIKAFKENLGECYLRDHEEGLRRFLTTIRDVVGPALHTVNQARLLLKHHRKEANERS